MLEFIKNNGTSFEVLQGNNYVGVLTKDNTGNWSFISGLVGSTKFQSKDLIQIAEKIDELNGGVLHRQTL